ncbi:MAG: 30S ribosomal protein S3 [Patescibacteria group bacterium]|jgi:small subunit ribosomal protein S3
MGKKINPKILRINIATTHLSKWFVNKQAWPRYLQQDVSIRRMLKKDLREAGVSRIEIRRSTDQFTLIITTSKPGVIIGRSGAGIEKIKQSIKKKFFGSEKIKIDIEIEEVRKPDLDAELVLQNIINQLEKRIPFRRAMKRSIESVRQAGGKGVKIICAGRLNGVEIARTETLSDGSIPSHTLRADIDYARGAAHTIYGAIGVKVWIYRGQIFEQPASNIIKPLPQAQRSKSRSSETSKKDDKSKEKDTVKDTIKVAPAKKVAPLQKRTIVKASVKKTTNTK